METLKITSFEQSDRSLIATVIKQDIALTNAINALNELNHIKRLEFQEFGQNYGIGANLLESINSLKDALEKAHFGRF